jgi:hypothetical protein
MADHVPADHPLTAADRGPEMHVQCERCAALAQVTLGTGQPERFLIAATSDVPQRCMDPSCEAIPEDELLFWACPHLAASVGAARKLRKI